MLDWAQEMIHSCLEGIEEVDLDREAGPLIASLSLFFEDPSAFLANTYVLQIHAGIYHSANLHHSFLPKVKGMSEPLPFHLGLLVGLGEPISKGGQPGEGSERVFRETSRWLIETADFAELSGEMAEPVDEDYAGYKVEVEDLTRFLICLIKHSTESDDLVSLFASKIVSDAPRFRVVELMAFWMPFLSALPGELIACKMPLDTPCNQQLCSALVKSLLDNFVGSEPVDTENQARGSVSCCCPY